MNEFPPIEHRARFASRGTTPPIGYVFAIEHGGEVFRFQAPMRDGILKKLRAWHADKGLEWPGEAEMESRLEHYICQLIPAGFCKNMAPGAGVPFFSSARIREQTRLFANKAIRHPELRVPREEANRRARICAACPNNMHGICTSCAGNEFQDIFAMFKSAGCTTDYDQVLDTCTACGCLLKTKVHVSIDLLSKLEQHEYPGNCWLHGTAAHKTKEPK